MVEEKANENGQRALLSSVGTFTPQKKINLLLNDELGVGEAGGDTEERKNGRSW